MFRKNECVLIHLFDNIIFFKVDQNMAAVLLARPEIAEGTIEIGAKHTAGMH